MTTTALVCDSSIGSAPRDRSSSSVESVDHLLACVLQQALRTLAKHSPGYAAVFASRPGVRLAGHIAAGLVESATVEGRRTMQKALDQVRIATTVEPGLDTNQLMDRVTGRGDPRREQGAGAARTLRSV